MKFLFNQCYFLLESRAVACASIALPARFSFVDLVNARLHTCSLSRCVNPSCECKTRAEVYLFPSGLAEGGKNIEQRLQRWWMERIKNFLNSLEEALTTRSLNVLHVNEVGNAGGGWMQRLRLFTSMKVRRIRLRASHRSVRTFGRTGEGEGRWGEQLGFSKIWMSKF